MIEESLEGYDRLSQRYGPAENDRLYNIEWLPVSRL